MLSYQKKDLKKPGKQDTIFLSTLLETDTRYTILITAPCFIIGHSFLIWTLIRLSRGIGLVIVTRILNTKLRLREELITGIFLEVLDGLKKFGGECSTFWHCLWYKPFIFLADRIYHPYVCKWFGIKVKNNSYYCLGSTNEKSWYGPKFRKRLVSKFNKSLEGGELFMPHLVFLRGGEDVDKSKLRSYLEKWEWDGVNSPIEFLILCNWFKIIFGNENIL